MIVIIYSQITKIILSIPLQECGPTICGDEYSDPELMEFLGAKLTKQLGNNL